MASAVPWLSALVSPVIVADSSASCVEPPSARFAAPPTQGRGTPSDLGRLPRVDQPGQRPVGGELRHPGLEPAPRAQEGVLGRTDGGLARVRIPLPLGGAVLERRAEPLEQLAQPLPGGLADGLVDVGEAYRERRRRPRAGTDR